MKFLLIKRSYFCVLHPLLDPQIKFMNFLENQPTLVRVRVDTAATRRFCEKSDGLGNPGGNQSNLPSFVVLRFGAVGKFCFTETTRTAHSAFEAIHD